MSHACTTTDYVLIIEHRADSRCLPIKRIEKELHKQCDDSDVENGKVILIYDNLTREEALELGERALKLLGSFSNIAISTGATWIAPSPIRFPPE